jgi:tetratricopeptide (TPR) repeat protein
MLAAATQGLGQTNEAEILFREAIQQYSQSLGTNDPMVGVFLKGYGLLLRRMGRTDEAVANLESAVAILQRAVGPDNQYTLEAKGHLTDTLALQGTNEAIVRGIDLHRR